MPYGTAAPESSVSFYGSLVGPAKVPSFEALTNASREKASQLDAAYTRVADQVQRGTEEKERLLREHEESATTLGQERAAARPGPLTLSAAPPSGSRAFLQPGESVLSQLQSLVLGLGQLGLQGFGVRGSAVGALAAMRGMAEGWAQGDAERVKRSYAEWDANTQKALAEHRSQTETYRDLLTDHSLTLRERLKAMEMRAQIQGDKVMAEHLRSIDPLNASLKHLEHMEQMGLTLAAHQDTVARWQAEQARHERDFQTRERTHREVAKRADEQLALRRKADQRAEQLLDAKLGALALPKQAMEAAKTDFASMQKLRDLTDLESDIQYLHDKGAIPKGPTQAEKIAAQIALQTSFGDERMALAMQRVTRLGTALVVGSEIAAGLSPSVARLKVIGEAEAAGINAIPKAFWDQFIPRSRRILSEQQQLARRQLSAFKGAAALLQGGRAEDEDEGWSIVKTE